MDDDVSGSPADEPDEGDDFDDEAFDPAYDDEPPLPPISVGGRMIGLAMVGLHGVIYGEKEQPAIVMDAQGAPPNEDFEVELDFNDPTSARVVLRRPPAEG